MPPVRRRRWCGAERLEDGGHLIQTSPCQKSSMDFVSVNHSSEQRSGDCTERSIESPQVVERHVSSCDGDADKNERKYYDGCT